jgi:hypothetical protein
LCGLLEAAVHALHLADGEPVRAAAKSALCMCVRAPVVLKKKGVPVEGVIGLFVVARMAGEEGTIAARRT